MSVDQIALEIIQDYPTVCKDVQQLRKLCIENFSLSIRLNDLLHQIELSKDYVNDELQNPLQIVHFFTFIHWTRCLKEQVAHMECLIQNLGDKGNLLSAKVQHLLEVNSSQEKTITELSIVNKKLNSQFNSLIINPADYRRCMKFLSFLNKLRKIKNILKQYRSYLGY